MTEDSQEQQYGDALLAGAIVMTADTRIGPFEVDSMPGPIAAGLVLIHVQGMLGPDAYHTMEVTPYGEGSTWHAYRTVQRLDLATRIAARPDYEPSDLVGRYFLVGA